MNADSTIVARQLALVRGRVAAATAGAGRPPHSVTLVAVSKGKSGDEVLAAVAAGQRVFGENRVQEADQKFAALRQRHPDLTLHLIGPLQTNKADDAVRLFDVIETLDRPRLAEALAKAVAKTGVAPKLFIEVNIGREPQKSGVDPDEIGSFLAFCRESCGLTVHGLMCIPPERDKPHAHFVKLKKLAAQYGLAEISMGMSRDFEEAILCGATEVRVGTEIFGERNRD